jgi:hypothetical protein
MKKVVALTLVLALTGCGLLNKKSDKDEPIRNQKLSTSFKADTIRIESDCSWYNFSQSDCEIVSIESVGTATTNGNTENNRRVGLIRAGDRARAAVRHFIQEDISSSRVNDTIAKNVEKANDRVKSRSNNSDPVAMSDTDAEKETNFMVRENSNNTAYQLSESIRVNAHGILRGFRAIKEETVGPQEVSVTIRWDKDSERSANELRRKFSN